MGKLYFFSHFTKDFNVSYSLSLKYLGMKSLRLSFLSAMWHISMRKNKIRIPIRGENIYFSPNDSAEIIKQKK